MKRPLARLFASLMSPRSALVLLFDITAVAAAWLLAYGLRFNLEVPQEYGVAALQALIWVLPVYGIVFLLSGLYRGVWRFASLADMLRIVRAAAMVVLAWLWAPTCCRWNWHRRVPSSCSRRCCWP